MRDRNSMLGSEGCVLKVGIKQGTDFILVLVFLSFNNPRFYRSRVFETCGETYTCFENNTASGTIFRKILLIYSYRRGEERFVLYISTFVYRYWIERERGREGDLFHFVIQIICICDIIHEACIIFRAYVLYVKCTIRVWIIKHGIVLKIKIMNEYKYSKKKKNLFEKIDRSIDTVNLRKGIVLEE